MDHEIIVVGGGHAGIEAALACARLGFRTLMITQHLDAIGRLSCNPAVGGLSKGNIVREVDALGGEMGLLIDASMIQFRILNRRRGPAVQAPRAQADKYLYARLAKEHLEVQKDLDLFQDTVTGLVYDGPGTPVRGVVTERGRRFEAKAVVLTTGTFMEGKIFIGPYAASGGRLGEPAAVGLGSYLRSAGFSVSRLKTGTPARVARSSIDFSKVEEQPGDEEMLPFSFRNASVSRPSESCYITYTNRRTHELIQKNMKFSPLYSGKIVGVGPRYCPSIEDKVVRFPDRERHQIFIEPEGYMSEEMYLNGISSSLPETVQEEFLRTLPGLENVRVMRPGYAVEYDFLDPRQLFPSLEAKAAPGLFIAGQTNGTSGYEEAACQGLMAGINAARKLQGREPIVLSRADAYTGVLIDDLVTLGTEEPYRMFTSRAEYRLSLRHDNVDLRMADAAVEIGLHGPDALERLEEKRHGIDEIKELLRKRRLDESMLTAPDSPLAQHIGKSLFALMKTPEGDPGLLHSMELKEAGRGYYPREWLSVAALDIKYEGYIQRQERQVARFRKMENIRIPDSFDYAAVEGISTESRQKLLQIRPLSVGQASRISGVRNSDIAVLLVYLGRRKEP
ncbi:tRNA uridine-5-carboxymethylaminomethyl(34) synthesis enzyme MnmG [Marispirochaeta aestuarii]|uniref:tRNA uridine-5-carboxymethylaminomethyl(34) synthesis enzyme MnmG n=1 Tax=Marispirochaeta aestuarii TaxID=1963862 RepID=UPI002ABE7913|nr:tRNA uridine-5-carboxymethylaminomethyl(34) synthesis enzyme MnmG [Marispirochaeta aestuarii]